MCELKGFAVGICLSFGLAQAVTASELFLLQDLQYKGAMRIPVGTYGESRMGFANGTFEVDSVRNSFYVVGHQHQQAIAEFNLVGFGISESIIDLPMSSAPIQDFTSILDRAPTGNTQELNRITGLELINGSLVLNAATSYDGDANNTNTTLVIENPRTIKDSTIKGFLDLDSRVHSAGWMTPIPKSLQEDFEADYISVLTASSGDSVVTTPLMDFSINNRLHDDLTNISGTNSLWTEISHAYIGFIVPGTDTYAVFGTSGGHESGIGYKITQDTGTLCAGYCPKIAADVYNYYWFWNVQDLLKVKKGEMAPYQVRPYDYGKFLLPHQGGEGNTVPKQISAASFDNVNNILYFMLADADRLQSKYESAPLMLAYEVKVGQRPNSPSNLIIE
jgi:hypothetical protein